MSSLEYSDAAKNILNKFHGVEVMLYVEGEEDVPFWEHLFSFFSTHEVKIQQAGGKNNLIKHIEDVLTDRVNILVAMDSDFSYFGDEINHVNIIKTYGYSIENTLISDETIHKVIRSIGRFPRKKISLEYCKAWLSELNTTVMPLLIFAIKNEKDLCGLTVIGDNACRFLKGKKTPDLCPDKISAHIDNIGLVLSDEEAQGIEEEIFSKVGQPIDLVNGHFLFSAILSFVSNAIRRIRNKVSISNESLFGALILAFESSFNEGHPHFDHYRNCIGGVNISGKRVMARRPLITEPEGQI